MARNPLPLTTRLLTVSWYIVVPFWLGVAFVVWRFA
jgi:hypothetical protein